MADYPQVNLPDVGGDNDTWGIELNDGIRVLETRVNQVKAVAEEALAETILASDEIVAALVTDGASATHTAITALLGDVEVGGTVTASQISDATGVGRAVLTAPTKAAAQAAIDAKDVAWLPQWEEVAGKPAVSVVGHTHTVAQVSGLSTVALSGSYNDLADRPAIPGFSIVTAAPGQVFFRRQVSGLWEARGSTRADVMVLWVVGSGDPSILPTEAVDGVDQILGA